MYIVSSASLCTVVYRVSTNGCLTIQRQN